MGQRTTPRPPWGKSWALIPLVCFRTVTPPPPQLTPPLLHHFNYPRVAWLYGRSALHYILSAVCPLRFSTGTRAKAAQNAIRERLAAEWAEAEELKAAEERRKVEEAAAAAAAEAEAAATAAGEAAT